MSNQPENEQTEIITPEEVRQYVLAEIDATKQAITELSEEELEEVAGGLLSFSSLPSLSRVVDHFNRYGKYYVNAAQTVTSIYHTHKAPRPGPPAPEWRPEPPAPEWRPGPPAPEWRPGPPAPEW